jgi:SAM-dependent methyltransferase
VTSVTWHDLECGSYFEDIPLWHELAGERPAGPILDVGAGTGRVTLDLARAGHEVVALDVDAELLAELARRADGLPVRTVVADARDFDLGERFGLVLAPMQTVQLLEGRHADFIRCAARHMAPGALLAAAIADLSPHEGEFQPLPDMGEREGWVFSSQPLAIRAQPGGMAIERLREIVSPAGVRTSAVDVVVLAPTRPEELEDAGRACGLRVLPRREAPETEYYVGSTVVVLGA